MNQIPRSALVPAALLAGLCPLVANSIHEDTTGNGAKILAEAAAGLPAAATISIVLFLVGFAALIVVLGVLAAAIARHTPALAGIVAVAGAAAVAIKLSEAQTGIALRETADVLDPGTAATLVAINRRLRWTDLDVVHFAGYALWNYMTMPFLLTRPDVAVEELSNRRLRVTYPPDLPTHSRKQVLHLDADGLISRLDYTAEVFGARAHATNRCLAYQTVDGLIFATRRRVAPRKFPGPTLVSIAVDDIDLH